MQTVIKPKYVFRNEFKKEKCERWIRTTYRRKTEEEYEQIFNEIVASLIADVEVVMVTIEKTETFLVYESKNDANVYKYDAELRVII